MEILKKYSQMTIKEALRIHLGRKYIKPSAPVAIECRDMTSEEFSEKIRTYALNAKKALSHLYATSGSESSDGTYMGKFELNQQNVHCSYTMLLKDHWLSMRIYHSISIVYCDMNTGEYFNWSGSIFDLVDTIEEYLTVMHGAPIMEEIST
jgi:hypothetical protein